MPDGLAEGFVVNVIEASSADGSRFDGSGESASHQASDELAAVLPASCGGERAVLSFQKAPGVDHHRHEELTLPSSKAERSEADHTADRDAVEHRIVRVFVRNKNSSMTRGCGPERPPPPREATK